MFSELQKKIRETRLKDSDFRTLFLKGKFNKPRGLISGIIHFYRFK